MHIKELVSAHNSTVIDCCQNSDVTVVCLFCSHSQNVRSQVLTTTGLLILVSTRTNLCVSEVSPSRNVCLLQEWIDQRLTWTPERFGGMRVLIVEAERLWRPEFAVINGQVAHIPHFALIFAQLI